MAILLNHHTPYLRIFNPATGDFAAFVGGKLEVEEGDPNYEVAMAEALRNPSIVVLTTVATCRFCGEALKSKAAVEEHVKANHYDRYLADKQAQFADEVNTEIKHREGYACDVCRPVQTFGSEDELALHVRSFHASPPTVDDEGNITGDGGENAAATAEVTVPAAKKK